jgi:hypothetical protein
MPNLYQLFAVGEVESNRSYPSLGFGGMMGTRGFAHPTWVAAFAPQCLPMYLVTPALLLPDSAPLAH